MLAAVAYPLVVFIVWPVLQMLSASFRVDGGLTFDAYRNAFGPDSSGMQSLWTSVWISLVTVIGSALVGVPAAFLLGRVDFPGRRVASVLVVFPLALPPLVGVLSFMFLFGSYGIVPQALKALFGLPTAPFRLEGYGAVLLVHIYSLFPFFTIFVSQALRGMDRSLEESSQALGAGRRRTLMRITLPLLRPAITSATLLVFMTSMASFSAPYLFAADRHFLSTDIYVYKYSNRIPEMLALTVVLAAISIGFLMLIRSLGGGRVRGAGKGTPPPLRPLCGRKARGLAALAAGVFCFMVVLPHLMIVLLAFVKSGSWTDTVLPQSYTLEHFTRLFSDSSFAKPVFNSIQMALMAALGVGVFGLAAGFLIVRGKFFGKTVLEIAVMLPWALPGSVIAVALITALAQPSWFTGNIAWVNSVWILPLAYFIRFIPLGVRSSASALEQIDPALEEASASLGAGWASTLKRILLPLVWPGCMAGMLLAFVTGLGEFISSILLYTPQNRPISVAIDGRIRIPDLGGAAAYSVLLLVVVLLSLLLSRKALKVGDQIRL
jgi:iron(III) transport system permease protein